MKVAVAYVITPMIWREYLGLDADGVAQFRLIWPANALDAYIDYDLLKTHWDMRLLSAESLMEFGDYVAGIADICGQYVRLERVK
jgi:hypothetical protein